MLNVLSRFFSVHSVYEVCVAVCILCVCIYSSVDATAESGLLGRLVNHSRLQFNCCTKVVDVDDRPRLILVASRDITVDEELLYDYGDRSKESLEAYPWLAS